ncbi:YlxM family DNA-binding protein [Candidatus Soleaferrea massiliensis]|uniref:YlxM family DNA-binding protein n=1 Tax=Candidatus Soleaferrea massiliensis TaxID=1470354 RepID=UPI0006947259|nr:YlxM family DNA-binding protein [Candidatus Soleaferrea massiliensis]
MEKNLQMSYLLDFYGEMLSEKQKNIMELYYCDDLSLSEIAETHGMTRQGVRDNLKRAEHLLAGMEEKLGLIERDKGHQAQIDLLLSDLDALAKLPEVLASEEAKTLIGRITGVAEGIRNW